MMMMSLLLLPLLWVCVPILIFLILFTTTRFIVGFEKGHAEVSLHYSMLAKRMS